MKKKIVKGVVQCVFVATALACYRLKADDVYNFYFQKAPGPINVYQGGNSPSSSNGVAGAPGANAQVHVPTPSIVSSQNSASPVGENVIKVEPKTVVSAAENNYSRWELSFFKSSFTNSAAELRGSDGAVTSFPTDGEWGLGVQLNIWSALGVEARVMQPAGRTITWVGRDGTLDFSGGFVFTPLRLEAFSYHFLDLALLAGYSSVPETWGESDGEQVLSGHPSSYYVGAKASINLGKNIAAIGSAEIFPGFNSSRLTVGMAIKL